ncbi:MAG: cation:proton antiporter subunit C [Thermotogota bacterium]|nr:cation:proton antiporter subunit C [Thermotogota bacterium]
MISSIIILTAMVSFFIGIAGLFFNRNILKKVLSLAVVEISTVLFYTGISSVNGITAPIITSVDGYVITMANPIPQAVIITGIVIGFAVLSLLLVFTVMLHNRYHTLDVHTIERIFERETQ